MEVESTNVPILDMNKMEIEKSQSNTDDKKKNNKVTMEQPSELQKLALKQSSNNWKDKKRNESFLEEEQSITKRVNLLKLSK